MKSGILSMGAMYVDLHALDFPIGEGLPKGKEIVGKEYDITPGGSALNFARICVSLGIPTTFIGKTGQDEMGELLAKLLKQEGVRPAFTVASNVKTNIAINFTPSTGNEPVMAVVGTANASLSSENVEESFNKYIDEVEVLFLGGCFKLKSLLGSYSKFTKQAKEKGVKIALDHGRVNNTVTEEEKEIIRKLIELVDYYLPSKDELLAVWGVDTVEEAVKKVQAVSDCAIVVTDSVNGATGYKREEVVNVPIFKVNPINLVGAGDSFDAGFIKAQIDGMNFEESIRFACATSAIKISSFDLPTEDSIRFLLDSK